MGGSLGYVCSKVQASLVYTVRSISKSKYKIKQKYGKGDL